MDDAEQMIGDYGLDSPVFVRGLALMAVGSLLVTVVGGILDEVPVMAGAFVAAILISVIGLVLVRSSRVHKIRERVRLVDRLELHGDERVLDVGCGRGLLVVEAARRLNAGGRAWGVDVWRVHDGVVAAAEHMLHNAALEGVDHRIHVASADVGSLPFADESFDAVVSGLALHHIEGFESRVHAIREISRVVGPGGRVVLIDRHRTRNYVDALRACNFVDVERSRRVWRFLPPARYVTGTKVEPTRRVRAPAVEVPESTARHEAEPLEVAPEQATLDFESLVRVAPALTEDAARVAAEEFLDEVLRPEQPNLDLVITDIREYPTSWVVGWNTRAWVETQSVSTALAGNGPIIVSKRSGFARLGISTLPMEPQLDPAPSGGLGPAAPPVPPADEGEQLELHATVTGERDGAGHEAQDGPSM